MIEPSRYTVDFAVRRAQPADAEGMGRIWQESAELLTQADHRWRVAADGPQRWLAALHGWLGREDTAVFVAERKGQVLGFAVGVVMPNRPGFLPDRVGMVAELAIDSHGRGEGGIGTQLVGAIRAWFAGQGITQLVAPVPTSQPIAQAFWRASGGSVLVNQMWLRIDKG
jgi:L-amino acid N-acyltransferase YncA